MPIPISFQVRRYIESSNEQGCMINESIMSDERWRQYNFIVVLLQYVIPVLVISATYGHMAYVSNNMQFQSYRASSRENPGKVAGTKKKQRS